MNGEALTVSKLDNYLQIFRHVKQILIVIIAILSLTFIVKGQNDTIQKIRFINVQTGFIGDNYNSAGIRFKTEYSKQIKRKRNWYLGTLFEMKLHQFEHTQYDIDEFSNHKPDIPANTFILAERFAYRFELWNDRISWNFGLAAGVSYLHRHEVNLLMPIFLAEISLNIRLTKRLYIETAPLIIFPPISTIYYSFRNYDEYTDYYGINMFPVGLRYKF